MATELDLPKALAELISQLNNLRKLVTINGKKYKYDAKSNSYKSDGKSFSTAQLKGKAREFYQTAKTTGNKAFKRVKIRPKKNESKTYTRKKGELTTTREPQYKIDAKNKANKEKLKLRKKARWDKATTKKQKAASGSFNVKQEWNPKTKKWETRYGQGTTKPKQSSHLKRGKQFVEDTAPKVKKNAARVLKKIKNVRGAGTVAKGLQIGGRIGSNTLKALGAAEVALGTERQISNIGRRLRNKPLKADSRIKGLGGNVNTEIERRLIKLKNAYTKEHGSLKGFQAGKAYQQAYKNSGGAMGVLFGVKAKKKNNKKEDNKKNESQSSTSQPKVTFESQYGKTKTKDKKPQPNTEKKSTAQIEWEKKTRNSPARASGAFKDKELWELQKRHRAWKAARKAGKLDEWRKKYKSR